MVCDPAAITSVVYILLPIIQAKMIYTFVFMLK